LLLSSLDFFSTKLTTSSIILSLATLWWGKPERYNMWLPCPPPVNPSWVWAASPGPLTTHPIIDIVIGSLICESFFSKILTVSITGNACRAHEGQEIMFTPLCLKFKDFKISYPILTSSTGFADYETLMVSPIPSISKIPIPIEDLILPEVKLPASVIPKCKG